MGANRVRGSAMAAWLVAALLIPPPADARPSDGVVVARLVEALKDPDLDVRLHLGAALAQVPNAAVDPLTAALRDANPSRRAGAAYALGLIGGRAADALPVLLDVLDDPELEVRRQASQAVNRVLASRPARRANPRPVAVRR